MPYGPASHSHLAVMSQDRHADSDSVLVLNEEARSSHVRLVKH